MEIMRSCCFLRSAKVLPQFFWRYSVVVLVILCIHFSMLHVTLNQLHAKTEAPVELSPMDNSLSEVLFVPANSIPSPQLPSTVNPGFGLKPTGVVAETWWPQEVFTLFNCRNVANITLKRRIHNGTTIDTHIGTYNGKKLVIKKVHSTAKAVQKCIKQLPDALTTDRSEWVKRCYMISNTRLMHDILMGQQLRHRNILSLQGFCYRSAVKESLTLRDHGLVAVYEYGLPLHIHETAKWPWIMRLDMVFELLDLLNYLEHSPVGSLRLPERSRDFFLLRDGHFKLAEIGDLTHEELPCVVTETNVHGMNSVIRSCPFGDLCEAGLCHNYNRIHNLFKMKNHLMDKLLQTHDYHISRKIQHMWRRFENIPLEFSADILRKRLQSIVGKKLL